MYNHMTDEELQTMIADALRDEENWMPKLNYWVDMKTSWEDIEQRLEAYEQGRAILDSLNTSSAMIQLQKITNKAKNMRYYIFGKYWDKK